ncbi:DUF4158 domain-containing protein [Nocardia niwae]|uniref:DUF4158 domain-containing protein n=1 Tax=Nocardia niwae TaxID=626084 RepID=UPI0009FC2D68
MRGRSWETRLIRAERVPTRRGFAIPLRFYSERGLLPRGRAEIPDGAIEYAARQVGVERTDIAFPDWSGRTIEYHRAQIRQALGFHECSVADAHALAWWFVDEVTRAERSGAGSVAVQGDLVIGADKWRNRAQDLPTDLVQNSCRGTFNRRAGGPSVWICRPGEMPSRSGVRRSVR